MIVNGVNIPDPDVGDVNFIERYENAQNACTEKIKAGNDDSLKWSESIRIQCTAVFDFFDEAFGSGTAVAVFGESVNLRTCMDAYAEACNGVMALDAQLGSYFRSKAASFENNRQKRRHKSNKKHKR